MTGYVTVYATFKDSAEAEKIAKALVERNLVACVNILPPIKSVYKWQGKTEEGFEVAFFAKTRKELFESVKNVILEMHSYDTPAIICLDIVAGDEKFLNWIQKETINP